MTCISQMAAAPPGQEAPQRYSRSKLAIAFGPGTCPRGPPDAGATKVWKRYTKSRSTISGGPGAHPHRPWRPEREGAEAKRSTLARVEAREPVRAGLGGRSREGVEEVHRV